jgi:heme-degrading monooxygenase HmoA
MPFEHDTIQTGPVRPVVRMTAFEGPPDRVEMALNYAREQMGAASQTQEGWLRTVGLTSSDGRRGMIIGFWENDEAVLESRATLAALRERAQRAGISITDHASYEVVFDDHVE